MTLRHRLALALIGLLSLAGITETAAAAASDWVDAGKTRVRLVSATTATGDGDRVLLGLQFDLGEDWKIYWRSPGDAGFPPRPDWSASDNLADTTIRWPAPERFSILGIDTMGYKHAVVLPVEATLADPGQGLQARTEVDYLACSDICVPQTASLALDLPAGPAASSGEAQLINRYLDQVPGDGEAQGLRLEEAAMAGPATLRVRATSALSFEAPDLFVEGPDALRFAKPTVELAGDGTTARLDLAVEGLDRLDGRLVGRDLTLTLVDGRRAAERTLTVAAEPTAAAAPAATAPAGESLLAILALAVLGGLILNLMPCVLPVLSIKLLGVVKHGGGRHRTVRFSFVFSALGIITAFLILAGALVALKAGGAAIGWGIQFQQPWFLALMTVIVVLFACNLWGFFEVRLPLWVSDLGEHASHVHGLGGHFLSGMLATLLATPCSAPFLGTAVGFSLARGPVEIFAVFAALGVGLALPYIAVAAAPKLATWLPRPGPWMAVLKKVLGFALAATGVWLVSVLWAQAGALTAGAIALLAAGLTLALWLRHDRHETLGRIAAGAAAMLAVLAVLAPAALDNGRQKAPAEDGFWVPFDEAAIPGLVAEGKVVFVDVTAEWCITCKVNETVVLDKPEVREHLASDAVVAMKADWTRPDDRISAYLNTFGRYGIPFNAVYGPKTPEGEPLPELLTRKAVLSALERASGQGLTAMQ